MWQHYLEEKGHEVIYINAWETDFDDEPIIPIISAILDGITDDTAADKAKAALQGVLAVTALAGSSIIKKTTGVDIKGTIETIESDMDLVVLGEKLYESYSYKKDAYETLKIKLKEYVDKLSTKPLIIFVDELDRVRPNYAVTFLEAIKHIFSSQGVCFVLAVDREQLEVSVKQLYGEIDFENYYRRFITRETDLPDANGFDLVPFLEYQADNFLNQKRDSGVRFPFKGNAQSGVLSYIGDICTVHDFSPREVESFFRIFSQFMATPQEYDRVTFIFWIQASVLLIATFIKNREAYHSFGSNSFAVHEIEDYIRTLKFGKDRRVKSLVFDDFITASLQEDQNSINHNLAKISLKNDPLVLEQPVNYGNLVPGRIQELANSINGSGRIPEKTVFMDIYERLENWKAFIE